MRNVSCVLNSEGARVQWCVVESLKGKGKGAKRQRSENAKHEDAKAKMQRQRCDSPIALLPLQLRTPSFGKSHFRLRLFYCIYQHRIWCRHRTDLSSIIFLEGLIEKELVIYTEIAQLLQWRKHLETLRFLATGKYNYAVETTRVCCSPPILGQLLSLLESFFSKKLCTVY